MLISTFTNEVGNRIKIKIKLQKDTGTNFKTKDKVSFEGVNICIIGPTSTSENTITLQEAKELHILLGQFLKK